MLYGSLRLSNQNKTYFERKKLFFRFLYFLKVKWSLGIFPLRFLQQLKTNVTSLTNNSLYFD